MFTAIDRDDRVAVQGVAATPNTQWPRDRPPMLIMLKTTAGATTAVSSASASPGVSARWTSKAKAAKAPPTNELRVGVSIPSYTIIWTIFI